MALKDKTPANYGGVLSLREKSIGCDFPDHNDHKSQLRYN